MYVFMYYFLSRNEANLALNGSERALISWFVIFIMVRMVFAERLDYVDPFGHAILNYKLSIFKYNFLKVYINV